MAKEPEQADSETEEIDDYEKSNLDEITENMAMAALLCLTQICPILCCCALCLGIPFSIYTFIKAS